MRSFLIAICGVSLAALFVFALFASRRPGHSEDSASPDSSGELATFRSSSLGLRDSKVPRISGGKEARSGRDLQITDGELWLLPEEELGQALEKIVMHLNRDGILDVIQRFQELNEPANLREEKLRAFVRSWARNDPDAAIDWARQSPEWQRDRTLENVCMDVASKFPLKAIETIDELKISETSPGIIENIAHTWADIDQPGATRWAKELPDGELRDQIFNRIALKQSESDPRGAVDLILSEIPPGTNQEEAAMSVLHQWALMDFSAAREWIATFPISPFRARAFAELEGISFTRKQTPAR